MGYGGRTTVAGDGSKVVALNPDVITILLGTNDWLGQRPVADYKAAYKQLLMNIHAVDPTVPVYLSALTNSTANPGTIPFSSYAAVPVPSSESLVTRNS